MNLNRTGSDTNTSREHTQSSMARPGALTGTWADLLAAEFEKAYMKQLKAFLLAEKKSGKTIYPPGEAIFQAFLLTPFEQVKVVILGQDPYHGKNQAHGLAFSVSDGVSPPPSLQNIFKEVVDDVHCKKPSNGLLTHWAQQGVLLLNSVLTVASAHAGSHQGKGWEYFTDTVISVLNAKTEYTVFMLWGSYAKNKGKMIDTSRHCVLTAPHPSPLSSYRGFFGCRHFSQANAYLIEHQKTPIKWGEAQE